MGQNHTWAMHATSFSIQEVSWSCHYQQIHFSKCVQYIFICTQYLVVVPFALITASIWRGMEVISLWHCWGGMEAQVSLTVAFSSSPFFGLLCHVLSCLVLVCVFHVYYYELLVSVSGILSCSCPHVPHIFLFMFTLNLSEHSPSLSVSRFGYFRVWRSFSKSFFPTRFLISRCYLIYIIIISPVLCRS